MILVTGATGRIGGRVVHELTAAGAAVRALTRRPDDVQLPGGAVAMSGDLRVAASVEPAFEGVDVAHLFPVPGWPVADLLALARKAGVRRIVLLSSASLPGGPGLIERQHRANEDAVRASGMPWTFVRPTAFMANDLSWAPAIRAEDTVYDAFPDASLAPVDEHDIAAVVAAALLDDDHAGHTYELSGPEPLTTVERVAILGEVLGRPLRFAELSPQEVRTSLVASHPPAVADAMIGVLAAATGTTAPILPGVHQATGGPPNTYAEWASRHADHFG
ncbi:NAD-dependent epimerase/dehydratase family protein [Nonomuraea deserti]|uniref:NAD-dependent epimerase/dehydratase family protein n=1 Tax=Nonomuraea deserti TaxID=1848322 RepID=A0A4R4W7L0_9ACTN|nr:NAD(P)H-binding protein [Nonomuraea deserti]TDD11694.1 NAD-dependent epimerase/dehydratase family protein [Nonomuraea deserti]